MSQNFKINITKTMTPSKLPDPQKLGFGVHFTDHMFLMDYDAPQGWHDARIEPYRPLSLDPAAMVFHYAQEMFEGLKAYRRADGAVQLFRPDKNIERMNRTNERLCIPPVDPQDTLCAIRELVRCDERFVPSLPGTSLYIRPFIIATEAHLGVKPSKSYLFCIILSPVAAYYAEGLNPVKIYVEDEFVRAVKGGMGFAKAGGNYAASLRAQQKAQELGFSQVLWLDGVERKFVDEVGTMNVFFVLGDEVVTPELGGSLLPGVTRDSCIELIRAMGKTIVERRISIDEVCAAHDRGTLTEMFGTGTAAVISPVGELYNRGKRMVIGGGRIGALSRSLYDTLTGIQWGTQPDPFCWTVPI